MENAVSRRFRPLILATAAVAIAVTGWLGRPTAEAPPHGRPVTAHPGFADLPLAFEPNEGQSDPAVRFQSRMAGYSLYLTAVEAVIGIRGADRPLRLAWQQANPAAEVTGLEPLPGKHHYLKGQDPADWHRNIPTYGKVRYRDLYPGVDLVYYGRDRHLEYDLVVAPGADPKPIELALSGMDKLQLDADGAVQVQLGQRTLSLSRPVIYQESDHGRQHVDGGYVRLADNRLGLRLGRYDASRPLIIDPVLTFSTYLGGTGAELARGVAVDPSGNVYVVGETTSQDISFDNAAKTTSNTDILIAKFDSAGVLQAVIFAGGGGSDRGFAVAADAGAAYIVGDTTSSGDFPLSNHAQQPTFGGNIDAFIMKVDSNLNVLYATYLGGSNAEEALGVAVDPSGNAYVAGATLSSNFPKTLAGVFNSDSTGTTSTALCTSQANGQQIPCSDAFVAKYNLTGTLSYATYLGGPREDTANAIAFDATGDQVVVTGLAYTRMFGFTGSFIGAPSDAFVIRLDNAGAIVDGVYVGGSAFDQGQAIAVDNAGNIYMAGITNSLNLPVINPLQASYKGGGLDGFIVKLNSALAPKYLTYLGGSPKGQNQLLNDGQDEIFGIAVDSASVSAYVVGETMSADFPEQSPLQSTWFGGGRNGWGDAFVTKVGSNGALLWSTYLGGSDDDWASGVAVGGSSIYVAGSTFSTDFPLSATPQQASNKGAGDAFLFRLDDSSDTADLQVTASGAPDLAGTGETITYTAKVSNLSSSAAHGVLLRATLPAGVTYQTATPANSCTVTGQQLDCLVGTVSAGGSATTTIKAVNNTAGDITFTARIVRAFQPDPKAGNNTASITTKAALGSSGGGSMAPFDAALLLMYLFGPRRSGRLRPG